MALPNLDPTIAQGSADGLTIEVTLLANVKFVLDEQLTQSLEGAENSSIAQNTLSTAVGLAVAALTVELSPMVAATVGAIAGFITGEIAPLVTKMLAGLTSDIDQGCGIYFEINMAEMVVTGGMLLPVTLIPKANKC